MTDFSALRVIDGGVGMYSNSQLPQKQPHPLWGCRVVQEAPDLQKRIHLDFLKAGANVIETNSYQLTVVKLMKVYNLKPEKAIEIIKKSGCLAQEAVREFQAEQKEKKTSLRPLIAGSIGPYGAFLADLSEYNGRYSGYMSVEELMDHHRPQLKALADHCDFFALETVPCLKEAQALVRLMREFPNHRAWLSFISLDGRSTCREESLVEAAELAAGSEAVFGVGLNCGLPPRLVATGLQLMRPKKGTKILIAYPNQGERWCEETNRFLIDPVKSIAESVPEWIALGCRWIGGCCGAQPVHIAEIAAAMDKEREKSAKK